MERVYDCIVLGAGGAGTSAAYHLARRGRRVLLLDQFAVPHDRGSSHGHSRIFRLAYDHPDYVHLAQHALDRWRELEEVSGQTLLTLTGGLDLGPGALPGLRAVEESLRGAGAQVETLDAGALMRRFPQWRVPGDWAAVYSPDAGIVNPTQTVELLAALARSEGATVLEHTPALDLDLGDPRAPVVRTPRGTFACRRLIVAAGAWLPHLVPELTPTLRVTLETTAFFRVRDLAAFLPGRFPVFIQHARVGEAEVYGFPAFGLPGVKIAEHLQGPATTAETRSFEVDGATLARLGAYLERHLPGAAGPVMQARTCLYTTTPTQDFLLDTHDAVVPGGSPSVLLASPCSGHGFKFVPALGELMADWADGVTHPLHFGRFRAGRARNTLTSAGS
ncbi:N-methyl-L-tryptophan oxidase [Deinococcus apachensis]|uniref:N-methyl-L-tryptophan oxidase n=1 Tax=Deinococcus apachensis TaxID=309886 RepID=UPI000377B944|nr:N-methyl-L-tryptophan oxidase [Deinococcus apachensis]